MNRFFIAAAFAALVAAPGRPASADEQEAKGVVDKAIKAAGGQDALDRAGALSWKSKGTITFNGNASEITIVSTAQGLDRFRAEFEGEFNGNSVKGVTVLNGDKGWRKVGDNSTEFEGDALAREKRNHYLQMAPVLLTPLKGKDFKLESAPEEKVGGKAAAVVKATGPDGKDFTLSFDKESGLPVKMVAKVAGFNGEEFTQETTFAAYKDFGGIKKATKVESQRDGEKFIDMEVSEFKVMDKAPPEAFEEPK